MYERRRPAPARRQRPGPRRMQRTRWCRQWARAGAWLATSLCSQPRLAAQPRDGVAHHRFGHSRQHRYIKPRSIFSAWFQRLDRQPFQKEASRDRMSACGYKLTLAAPRCDVRFPLVSGLNAGWGKSPRTRQESRKRPVRCPGPPEAVSPAHGLLRGGRVYVPREAACPGE